MILDVVEEVRKKNLEELRVFKQNYFECVVTRENLKEIVPALERFFGPALKPAEEQPSEESSRFSSLDGGVRKGQTLYLKIHEGDFVCALLWPWGDGLNITIKIAKRPIGSLMPPKPLTFVQKLKTLFDRS